MSYICIHFLEQLITLQNSIYYTILSINSYIIVQNLLNTNLKSLKLNTDKNSIFILINWHQVMLD